MKNKINREMSEKTNFLDKSERRRGSESPGVLRTAPHWQILSLFQFGLAACFILRELYFWVTKSSAG